MSIRINLSGKRFGKLLVTNEYRMIKGRTHWLCKCDCGNERFVCSKYMRDGDTSSCGCLVRGKFGEASRNRVFREYKSGAKRRNINFNLSRREFLFLTSQDCFYCNGQPSNIHKSQWNNGDFIYNGIDRLDNNQGYLLSNCIPCCKICNVAKNNLKSKDFLKWVKDIYNNLIHKGLL